MKNTIHRWCFLWYDAGMSMPLYHESFSSRWRYCVPWFGVAGLVMLVASLALEFTRGPGTTDALPEALFVAAGFSFAARLVVGAEKASGFAEVASDRLRLGSENVVTTIRLADLIAVRRADLVLGGRQSRSLFVCYKGSSGEIKQEACWVKPYHLHSFWFWNPMPGVAVWARAADRPIFIPTKNREALIAALGAGR